MVFPQKVLWSPRSGPSLAVSTFLQVVGTHRSLVSGGKIFGVGRGFLCRWGAGPLHSSLPVCLDLLPHCCPPGPWCVSSCLFHASCTSSHPVGALVQSLPLALSPAHSLSPSPPFLISLSPLSLTAYVYMLAAVSLTSSM